MRIPVHLYGVHIRFVKFANLYKTSSEETNILEHFCNEQGQKNYY